MGVAIVQFISATQITGGALGLRGIPSLSKSFTPVLESGFGSFLKGMGIGNIQMSYYFVLLITIVSLFILYRFEHSRIGWTLKALAQSPEVAASTGINERYFRLLSVCFGCFFAGLIGAVYAHYNTSLSPNSYGMGTTLWLLMYMMIGGSNKFLGPIVGAIILELVKQLSSLFTALGGGANTSEAFVAFTRWVGAYSAYIPFLTAFILLFVVYFLPGGLVSIPALIRGEVTETPGWKLILQTRSKRK